ncbi:ribosomal protein S18-alanine N-acetyltransferase [Candidatus Aminicenantes bacterium AC-335-B20]|nr:ribosomal protein S18-alanine N-acetyltransferase [Candidatus Aminicenantes bacterium AC-335-G13]MCP2599155.1 ribosomal protein S18-alanine N-acetyltransferase [Candidatus Aminicenantes bacterium AC-335-B20]MCP2618419.1 ribosomal protein S18-alanine N-acetyltransferase [Candidatus Aminicenantes bacterium AC-335-A11]MCP2620726.1 ribosomal protein S18-alanine N-acetyltransferase [Candidatus Aminicenantes bacterium AC-334-E05]
MKINNFNFISLRKMREEDVDEVVEIEKLSFSTPWSRFAFLSEIYNQPISSPFIIEDSRDNRIIGYVIYWVIGDEAHINNIALHPEYRGKGIGEFVLRKIIELIKKAGAKSVSLEVRPSNIPARKLYRKLGFQLKAIRKDYYINPKEDALILVKNLINNLKKT